MSDKLPPGWVWGTIGDVAIVNPTTRKASIPDDLNVSFVPMAAVTEVSGRINLSEARPARVLKLKGYRSFVDGDVLVAKITPSMENGKAAVARGLENSIGFGSTEFHVLRPLETMFAKYLFHYVVREPFRAKAARAMTGTAGQLRVPPDFLRTAPIPIAPPAEQERIVAAIDEHFSRLDAAGAATDSSVNRIPSLLEAAVQAQLHKYPTSSAPLHRFLIQRLSNGRSVPSATTAGFPVLRLTCLRDGTVATSETKQGDFGDVDPTRYVIEPDDFLISRGNGSLHLVGLGGLVPAGASSVAYPDTLIRARVDESQLRPRFLSHIWNSRFVRRQLEAQARTTAGIYKINQSMIEQVLLPIPSPDDQDKIVQQLDELRSSVRVTEREVERVRQRIAELRRSVLTAAFSGELVPQDPDDEPASALLERIAASRPARPARRRART